VIEPILRLDETPRGFTRDPRDRYVIETFALPDDDPDDEELKVGGTVSDPNLEPLLS
jgi:hypothetical protein